MHNRAGKILLLLPISAALIAVAALYLLTCPRDLSWAHHAQDSGDLITCAHILGIPHPTGYPLYTMIGHLFTRLDFDIFSAWPIPWNNSAFKMILFVIITSLANLFLFWRIHIVLQRKLGMEIAGTPLGALAAAVGALSLGTSYLYWSQSIVAEVYILNLFFIDLTLLTILTLPMDESGRPKPWGLFALGFVTGLGIFHHLTYVLFIPGLFILALFCLKKPTARGVAWLFIGFFISLLPLLYLPICSAQNPPVDTTNPENWRNFLNLITAAAYRQFLFHHPISEMSRHIHPFNNGEQFGTVGILLIGIGLIGAFLRGTPISRAFLAFCLISTGVVLFHATNYCVSDRIVFFLPAFFAMAHLLALGAAFLIQFLWRKSSLLKPIARGIFLCLIIIGWLIWQGLMVNHAYAWGIDVSNSQDGKRFGSQAFANLDRDAIIFAVTDGKLFSLVYHRYVLFADLREDVDIIFVPRVHTTWWWENLSRGHPNVLLSIGYTPDRDAIVDNIILTNSGKRPIYTSWPLMPLPKGYKIVKAGNIFRIIPAAEYDSLVQLYHRIAGEINGDENQETPEP